MSRKTKQQKIIADLRKQVQLQSLPIPAVTKISSDPIIKNVSLPQIKIKQYSVNSVLDHSHLKMDLIKVGSLVTGAIVIELIAAYAITHGALSSIGIT